jgi:hypothetical protein
MATKNKSFRESVEWEEHLLPLNIPNSAIKDDYRLG